MTALPVVLRLTLLAVWLALLPLAAPRNARAPGDNHHRSAEGKSSQSKASQQRDTYPAERKPVYMSASKSSQSQRVVLNNKTLHQLLRPIIPLTAGGYSLPVLEQIILQRHGDHLTASATDRYRIGVQRVPGETWQGKDFRAAISAADAKKLLPLFKPNRRSIVHQARLAIELVDDTVVVEALPPAEASHHSSPVHEFEGMRLTLANQMARDTTAYPDIWELTAKRLAKSEPGDQHRIAVNFDLLAGFREARLMNQDHAGTMRLTVAGESDDDSRTPLLVEIGPDFIGLLMPRREVVGVEEIAETRENWREVVEAISARAIETRRQGKELSA